VQFGATSLAPLGDGGEVDIWFTSSTLEVPTSVILLLPVWYCYPIPACVLDQITYDLDIWSFP